MLKHISFRTSKKTSVALASLFLISGNSQSFSQNGPKEQVDQAIIGEWAKAESGNRLVIKTNGDVDLFFSGQASQFNGRGSFERCTESGSNICINGERFRCAFYYSVVQKKLSLQLRKAAPESACQAIAGAYESAK